MKVRFHWLAGLALAFWFTGDIALSADSGDSADPEKAAAAELDLAEVRKRISALEKETRKAVKRRGAAEQALREAEISESRLRRKLKGVESELSATENRLGTLRADSKNTAIAIRGHRAGLERQLRDAYVAGREDWLRAVLSQRDAGDIGRQLVYASYFARHRNVVLASVRADLQALEESERAVAAEQARLADIKGRQRKQLGEISGTRESRSVAVARIDQGIASRSGQLERLTQEAEDLESLVANLTRLLSNMPISDSTPFKNTKGRLDWPTDGRVLHKYGQAKADGRLRWDGVLLGAPAGADIRAIHNGRVVYSDWLPGMGLLLVIDHGDGYMSLYGHNQDLIMEVGDWVGPGAVVAHVGDSGGQAVPALYLEIRKDGQPVDPGVWVKR